MDAGLDQRVGAGRRASLVRVGLEVDVKRAAARLRPSCLERENLGMLHARVGIGSCTHNVAVRVSDDRAHVRIRRGLTYSGARQFECAVKMLFVG